MQTTHVVSLGSKLEPRYRAPAGDSFVSEENIRLSVNEMSEGFMNRYSSPKYSGFAVGGVLPVTTRPISLIFILLNLLSLYSTEKQHSRRFGFRVLLPQM